ncbi:hypothetical protein FOZ62_030324 [Perkinsus olseni]|uniref:Uncharacterized protein n=1 Tax=Perkinsus olseni TaxID=32597 RepID=A0A7J6PJW8_PEROL|nr:hypothetical protein FOZ62_030324 [Perkinsus olseni]
MNKRKEMMERLPRDGRSDGTGAVRDNAVSGREQLHNSAVEGEPPRKEVPIVRREAAPSVSSGSGWGATNGNTEAPNVVFETALDWRNAPDTKPDKPLEPVQSRRGGRDRWNHRWNGYHYGDASSRGRRGWSSRE